MISANDNLNIPAVASETMRRFRRGERHPPLGRAIEFQFPGLTKANFNTAADLAWTALTEAERDAALGEAGAK